MKRFLSALICLSLLFSLCSPIAEAAPQSGAVTTVIAASDFQPDGEDYAAGTKTVQDILAAMGKDGITSADGLLFCGDYHAQLPAENYVGLAKQGLEALKNAVSGVVTGNLVLGKGNHDALDPSIGISPSGANDPASGAYGVFLINEDDYMWFNPGSSEARVRKTAQNLKAYLDEKRAEGFAKPIFVVSHLALNYSMRTNHDGDGKYAHYIFDVLNEAGEAGLNIFFMFGHNHSNGWDDYLGGSSVYLAKGDKILISQGDQKSYEEKTLEFTYLNAGYVGYYRNVNGADDTLTMTVFQISEDEVTVARYDANGKHVLKSSGVKNTHAERNFGAVESYLPNAAEYASPQTVPLTKTITPLPPEPQKEGACYTRVTDFSELADGGKYLLMLCGSPAPGSGHEDGLMVPSVVTKEDSGSRTGFNVEFLDDLGGETIYGDYAKKEWTFTKADTGWQIGNGTLRAGLSKVGDEMQAQLLNPGNAGVVSMTANSGKCTFHVAYNGSDYYLNYNWRGLINGYAADPAEFYIYKFAGYDVRVEGGSADLAMAAPGAQVSITAGAAPEGQVFDKWIVELGGVTLSAAEKVSPNITVTMPKGALRLRATYRAATGADAPSVRPEPCESHSFGSWMSVAEADCTSAGMKWRACVTCGRSERKRIAPLGHEYSSSWTIDVPATETAAGERSHHCIRCGERTDITEIPMIPMTLPYSDVKVGDWHYTAVQYVVSHNLFNGVGSSRFAPDEAMNRAMLATVLWRMGGQPAASVGNPFNDVASGTYYTDAVLWAWSDSMFPDADGLKFLPAENATREQVAVALYQYSRAKGYDTTKRADLLSFPDGENVSDYAKEALSWAVAEGLIAGENRGGKLLLDPQGSATRAQVATILMRYQMDIVESQKTALPAN